MIMKQNEQKQIIIKVLDNKEEEITKFYLKTDVFFLADVFEKFVKVSTEDFGLNSLYCISLSGILINVH